MNVGTEQEWQAARKGLLAAERELEEHAKRVEEQRRVLPHPEPVVRERFAVDFNAHAIISLNDLHALFRTGGGFVLGRARRANATPDQSGQSHRTERIIVWHGASVATPRDSSAVWRVVSAG